jgi:hypothetical protein
LRNYVLMTNEWSPHLSGVDVTFNESSTGDMGRLQQVTGSELPCPLDRGVFDASLRFGTVKSIGNCMHSPGVQQQIGGRVHDSEMNDVY